MTRVGTSGWSYREWRGTLYPKGTAAANYLKMYAENFDTVEINNTFYRMPQVKTLQSWVDKTPPGFLFAVKAWRAIAQSAVHDQNHIKDFFTTIDTLGDKLGPILFQLPPNRDVDTDWLASLLAALPGHCKYTFELRDRRWQIDPVYDILRQYNVANCFYDLKQFRNPEVQTADWLYFRLHGPLPRPYMGGYSPQRLTHYARLLAAHPGSYCYFDNTMSGDAVDDARTLLKYLHHDGRSKAA